MTIFLTTQYLEEADELADRVAHHQPTAGPRDRGDTGRALKRSIGTDLIVAEDRG